MAQRTIVQLTDDLDGKNIPDGKGETVRFGLDRQDYEIDLADKNAKALREALQTYIAAGRRIGGSPRPGGARSGRARANGGSTASGWSVPDFMDTGLGCQVGEFSES